MTTRRDIIKSGAGLAAIIAAGRATAAIVRSMLGARNAAFVNKKEAPQSEYWGLCFTALDPSCSISMTKAGSSPPAVSLQYSTNAINWETFTVGETVVNLTAGNCAWFKATTTNSRFASSTSSYNLFNITGRVSASGNIMSLLDGSNNDLKKFSSGNAFINLFYGCSTLVEPPDLPATTASNACYFNMFRGCTSLTRIAKMPSAISAGSYEIGRMMYAGCESLMEVDMSGTTITTTNSYGMGSSLFRNCTSLRKIKPVLATVGTLVFDNCSSIELVDFRHVTSVVSLANINAFGNTNGTYKIVVPDSLYSSWTTATNWKDSSIVGHIVRASDYTG